MTHSERSNSGLLDQPLVVVVVFAGVELHLRHTTSAPTRPLHSTLVSYHCAVLVVVEAPVEVLGEVGCDATPTLSAGSLKTNQNRTYLYSSVTPVPMTTHSRLLEDPTTL